MALRGKWHTKFLRFFESTTQESIPVAPYMIYDDFDGKAIETTVRWTTKDTSVAGDAAPALTADGDN